MITVLKRLIFFFGWLLSPFTFWNDAIVNIPFAYLCANIVVRLIPVNFLVLVTVFYWLSNILGIALMYLAGRDAFAGKGGIVRGYFKLIIAIAIYTLALYLLGKSGILKPV